MGEKKAMNPIINCPKVNQPNILICLTREAYGK